MKSFRNNRCRRAEGGGPPPLRGGAGLEYRVSGICKAMLRVVRKVLTGTFRGESLAVCQRRLINNREVITVVDEWIADDVGNAADDRRAEGVQRCPVERGGCR